MIIVHAGRVKVFATDTDGHSVLLAVRGPGDILGDLGAIDGKSRSASGLALEAVDVQLLTADDFRAFLADTPGAALGSSASSSRVCAIRTVSGSSSAHTMRWRGVASRLVELAETSGEASEGGIRITLALTQEDLAQWVAASRKR